LKRSAISPCNSASQQTFSFVFLRARDILVPPETAEPTDDPRLLVQRWLRVRVGDGDEVGDGDLVEGDDLCLENDLVANVEADP